MSTRAESAVRARREKGLVSRLARRTSRTAVKDWIAHVEAAIQAARDIGVPQDKRKTQPVWLEHCRLVSARSLALLICDAVLRPRPEDKNLTDWVEERRPPSCQSVANDIGAALKVGADLARVERKKLRDTVGMELLNIAYFAGLIGPLQSGQKGLTARCVLSSRAQEHLAEIHTALVLSGELLADQPLFTQPPPLIDVRPNWRGLEPPVNLSPDVILAVQAMQSTAWRINEPLLHKLLGSKDPTAEVRKAVKAYAKARDSVKACRRAQRKGEKDKLSAKRLATLAGKVEKAKGADKAAHDQMRHWITLLEASALAGKTFYYRVRLDYRGRMYQIGGRLQYTSGDDLARALLEFADGAPLNDTGHAALKNYIGTLKPDDDKHRLQAARMAQESMGAVHFPVALDCTQSGLQTYSLLMRDKDLGAKVNVYRSVPDGQRTAVTLPVQPLPFGHSLLDWITQDFYRLVENDAGVKGIDRGIVKALGNPQIYGAGLILQTRRLADLTGRRRDDKTVRKDAAKIRATILKHAPAFATLSAWLRAVAALAAANNLPLSWTLSDGFTVLQDSRRLKPGRDRFWLPGHEGRSIDYGTKDPTDRIDTHKQESQAAANYVHSYDALLLREVLRGALQGRLAVACAHDSFACHANDVVALKAVMVEALGSVYTDSPLVRLWRELDAQGVFCLPWAHTPWLDDGFKRGDLAT